MLTKFAPRSVDFKVALKDGRSVNLTLRPFTLLDQAWMQRTFSTKEDQMNIAQLKVEPMAKIVWHQMDQDSHDIFNRIKFTGGQNPEGYERFLEALTDVNELLKGFTAFAECRGENGFTEKPSKKKAFLLTLMNGLKCMTSLRKSTA